MLFFALHLFLLIVTFPSALQSHPIYHPVSTKNTDAQWNFNQGLTYIFAFNYDLAFKHFEIASQIDSNLAMAYWGMALALGQNINSDVTPQNEIKAYGYIQNALSRMENASHPEQAYIKALLKRYTDDPKAPLIPLRYRYRDAMKEVMLQYREDLDAATLYAESILDLDPWNYWINGKPQEGILEAINTLQSVLIRNPDHIGANHYLIHAWEESSTPENALLSAFRLTSLFPEAGHLLHMPCHIFLLCGYYEQAIQTSLKAIQADLDYIQKYGMSGEYPLNYLTHNFMVLIRAYMLAEQYEKALDADKRLQQIIAPYVVQTPHLASALAIPIQINLYFFQWEKILELCPPPIHYSEPRAFWHFARALAFINLGKEKEYEAEKVQMLNLKNKIPQEFGSIENFLVEAAFAKFQKKFNQQIEYLQQAVLVQDHLSYGEPPKWYIQIRAELGEALLSQKLYLEAEEVFRKALRELQRNGRLLQGLAKSLQGQDKLWDAWWVEREANAGSSLMNL